MDRPPATPTISGLDPAGGRAGPASSATMGAGLWTAQILTLSRIPLGFLFWITVTRPAWSFPVMALAGLSDVADGAVARHARRAAEARGLIRPPGPGAWLDPLCDKFFVGSVLAATYVRLGPPLLLLGAVALRELILIPLAAVYRLTPSLRTRLRYDFRAGPLGKATTVAQFLAIGAMLMGLPAQVALAGLAAGLGLLASIAYIQRGLSLAAHGPHGSAST